MTALILTNFRNQDEKRNICLIILFSLIIPYGDCDGWVIKPAPNPIPLTKRQTEISSQCDKQKNSNFIYQSV